MCIYIYVYIYTRVDLCIYMHRALWIRSCIDLAVVLAISDWSYMFCHVFYHVFCLQLNMA